MFRNIVAFVTLLTAVGCFSESTPATVSPTTTVSTETTVDTVPQTTQFDDMSSTETVEQVTPVEDVELADQSPSN